MLNLAKRFLRYVHHMMFHKPISEAATQKLDSHLLLLLNEFGFDPEAEVKKDKEYKDGK